jgi:deoxycytidylate deaminase
MPAAVPANVSEIVIADDEMWLEWRGHRVPATPEKLRDLGAVEISPAYDDCPALHAEANALMFSDRAQREGGTIYVSSGTCGGCAKLVANSGLKRAVYATTSLPHGHSHRNSDQWYDFLRDCGLEVTIC